MSFESYENRSFLTDNSTQTYYHQEFPKNFSSTNTKKNDTLTKEFSIHSVRPYIDPKLVKIHALDSSQFELMNDVERRVHDFLNESKI